jgi:hypothetical protein
MWVREPCFWTMKDKLDFINPDLLKKTADIGGCALSGTYIRQRIAGLHPQSTRHFARRPSARVSQNLRLSDLSHVIAAKM